MHINRNSGSPLPGRSVRSLLGILLIMVASIAPVWAPTADAAGPLDQAQQPQEPSITVVGEGEVWAEPDMAVVTVGVTAVASTSQEAMAEVSRRLANVIVGAKALGLQDRDVQTTGLSLQPVYRQRRGNDDAPLEIQGYRASNNVSLTVRNLSRAGAVLDSATASGANVVGSLSFSISNPQELRLQALAAATANAETRARAIASAAGVTLRGVLSISEDSVSIPRPISADVMGLRALGGDAAPAPVEGGEMVIRARVRATYGI